MSDCRWPSEGALIPEKLERVSCHLKELTMLKVRSLVGAAAALIATPLMGLPAWADVAACPTAPTPLSVYTAAGFSCSVGEVIFSVMSLVVTNGSIGSNPTITPLIVGNENSLELSYSAPTRIGNPPVAVETDFTWTYTVTAALGFILTDAASSLTGFSGPATLAENLFGNGNPSPFPDQVGQILLSLPTTVSGTTSITPPQFSLLAVKDQKTGADGEASALINGFSVTPVPGPIVGAGLPGLAAACVGLIGLPRRRRRQIA